MVCEIRNTMYMNEFCLGPLGAGSVESDSSCQKRPPIELPKAQQWNEPRAKGEIHREDGIIQNNL